MPSESILIVPSYGIKYGSQNILYKTTQFVSFVSDFVPSYPFQQNNNLLYLTGFNEPDSCLVLQKHSGQTRSLMFVKENDLHSILWSGPSTGSRRLGEYFGIEEARPTDCLSSFFKDLPTTISICHAIDENCMLPETLRTMLAKRGTDFTPSLHTLRVLKRAAETTLIKEATKKSAESFVETMKWSVGSRKEAAIAAKMEFECRLRDAESLAYVPVVAGGPRANILHYTRNNMTINDDEMVLMDAGGKFNGYCTDISRTWPLSKRFGPAQRELYEAVLLVQLACIQACALDPSYEVNLLSLNHLSTELMTEQLEKLGFSNPQRAVHQLYPHSIGHYLGLDLHDCPKAPQDITLDVGMVLTIEPGLYVPPNPAYPEKFHGIGIRIEDDILIEGPGKITVLTDAVPKAIDHIETLLNS